MVSFQIYWVAGLCCKINSKWLHSRLEKQQILILLQRGDITSAMSVIKNCDDWYYQTLEIQKHSVTKRENHKSTKTQEIDVFAQRHYFRQVTDIEITTLDWSQKCNDLSDCRRQYCRIMFPPDPLLVGNTRKTLRMDIIACGEEHKNGNRYVSGWR